jgi:hypothetical protein
VHGIFFFHALLGTFQNFGQENDGREEKIIDITYVVCNEIPLLQSMVGCT